MLSLRDSILSSKEPEVEHRLPALPLLLPPLLPDAGRIGTVRPSTLAVLGLLLAVDGRPFDASVETPKPMGAPSPSAASAYSRTSGSGATFSMLLLVFPFSARLFTKKRISRFKLSLIIGGSAKKEGFFPASSLASVCADWTSVSCLYSCHISSNIFTSI